MTFGARTRYWLPLLPLLGLLGATYWLNLQVLPETIKLENTPRHDPDSVVEDFSALRLNEQGTPHFRMSAKKMLHFPDDDSTTLEQPHLTLLAADRPTLLATAKTGVISSKGDEIFLHENVEVLREASAQYDELRLQTEYLHIIPDQELVNSNLAVTLFDKHSTVNAIGLEMNSGTRSIKLLSNVKSEYVPHK